MAVARNLHRLMAIKDEYEVARLYTDGVFQKSLKEQFEGRIKLKLHMAPPLLSQKNPDTGLPEKRAFGPWMLWLMRPLARMKRLRGSWLDIFGRTPERRMERALIAEYEAKIERLLPVLKKANLGTAVQYASVPDMIRGFGHIKERNAKRARTRYAELEAVLFGAKPRAMAAE
jgi:indolepyruvate ferredoxin oxidoreductase